MKEGTRAGYLNSQHRAENQVVMALVKKSPIFYLLLLCFLVIVSEIAVTRVEAATCETPSKHFNGLCIRSSNCASICHGEHFTDGRCQGVRRRCMCLKPC
ncbi:hypothetical protein MRB53_000263 [Persea americana]|uniref:Uncharacterized protein n=1 Tax=Persea americana TaxID=3435 RepID=A0ACC2MPA8_PERAE|nr:hypothetical protein MRB53_000263 [Persea americana]